MYNLKSRKRSALEDEEMTDHTSHKQQLVYHRLLNTKRFKSNIQKQSTRDAMFNTMDKDALIHIINTILNKHPEVRQNIMALIPPPTIHSSLSILSDMEKKLLDSFPFNRNGLARDDYTFSRVREYLINYIDTITQYTNHFTTCSNIFPTTCFTFLDHATHMAHRLPVWDNYANNALKSNLYQDLIEFWKHSIQSAAFKLRENEHYSSESVNTWAKSLAQHNSITNGVFTEAVAEFTKQLGFMIGFPTEDTSNYHLSTTATAVTIVTTTGFENNLPSASLVGARK